MRYGSLADSPVNTDVQPDSGLDVLGFIDYLRKNWRAVLICCAIAVTLAGVVSTLLPKRYTATASILIEPPPGTDPRAATAVSPVYLESLKTYEHFASSDSLFAQALQHLHLREAYSGIPIESLKRRVLQVTKPRDTKVLEISSTLDDPNKAQAFAQYIAEQTVGLSRSLDRNAERDLTDQARKIVGTALTRLQNADRARDAFLASDPIQALEAEITGMADVKQRLERDLAESKVELAENETRKQALSTSDPGSHDQIWIREQIAATRGRIASIEQQLRDVTQTLSAKTAVLESRKHKREVLDGERLSARTQYDAASTRSNDILATATFRGERLEIIDPGTVPERASSPNTQLNVILAFLVAFIGSVLYLGVRFSYSRLVQLRDISSAIGR